MLGGLLQHTVEVAHIGRSIAKVRNADHDLVLAGALLHDIGKLESYRWDGGVFETTPENLASWIGNPQALKPGTTMPDLNVDEAAIADIVAYLQTLE